MSNTELARPATLAEIKRHIANNRPTELKVTIFVGDDDQGPVTVATGTNEFGTVKVGTVLRFCEVAAQHGGTFVLHS